MSSLELLAVAALAGGTLLFVYTYLGYPILLWILGRWFRTPSRSHGSAEEEWPSVSIVVPAYNEEQQLEGLLRSLVSFDYPRDRLQILVVSDASTDRTDEIAASFQDQGVELLRMPERGGKTRAENATVPYLRGGIIVNTDASIRFPPEALKPLVARFADPEIGVASGRDISVGKDGDAGTIGESGYVGYEMTIRDLETRAWGIVGASGCFYAIRPELHRAMLPEHLSLDFAAALVAREHGLRAVSVPQAVCYVPRAASMKREYLRKVRTITRGLSTLAFKRSLLNPFKHGLFAWMLFSHKVCRWLIPWAALAALTGLAILSLAHPWARILMGGSLVFLLLAWAGWRVVEGATVPRALALPAFVTMGNVAAAHALIRVLQGSSSPVWEPTRRDQSGNGRAKTV